MNDKERVEKSLELLFKHGGTVESHHMSWVIDQVVKILAGDNYEEWVDSYENPKEGEDGYPDEWVWPHSAGIAP